MAEEPLVVICRPLAAALALLCQEEVDRLRVGDALRPDAAESELGEDRARLVARLGQGNCRVTTDRDSPVLVLDQECPGAALADADGECARLERGIPEIRLPIRGGALSSEGRPLRERS